MKVKQVLIVLTIVVFCSVVSYRFGVLTQIGSFKSVIESSQEHHSPPSVIIEPGSAVEEASYIIFKDDEGWIYAKNGQTGAIEFSGTDFADVIEDVVDALPQGYNNWLGGGGIIFIRNPINDYYPATRSIDLTNHGSMYGDNKRIHIIGEGGGEFAGLVSEPLSGGFSGPVIRYTGSSTDNFLFDFTKSFGVIVEGITIDLNKNANGILLARGSDGYSSGGHVFRNVGIFYAKKYGIASLASEDNVFYDCHIGSQDTSYYRSDTVPAGISSQYQTLFSGAKGTLKETFYNCRFDEPTQGKPLIGIHVVAGEVSLINTYSRAYDYHILVEKAGGTIPHNRGIQILNHRCGDDTAGIHDVALGTEDDVVVVIHKLHYRKSLYLDHVRDSVIESPIGLTSDDPVITLTSNSQNNRIILPLETDGSLPTILDSGSKNKFVGSDFENSGTEIIPVDSTSVDVNHGINPSIDPSKIKITVTPNWNTTVWVTDKTNTQFTVYFGTQAPSGASIDWYAEV